eukprot:TRINITY_DN3500_c0_g1_i3.p1 TRINITY_DN3500_c0_g1~~TRINITY_DN3500_c0_g1_i3.p1  ORF type:complete len:455 (-),score=93.42 TRINITY_DN3500_c0_g1_i3:81-1385(-)
MATSSLINVDGLQVCEVVTYKCSCQRWFPLSHLYFCTSCQKLLCKFCVLEEIDSYYCILCLENMLSAEAMQFSNRCRKCFECPVCFRSIPTFTKGANDNIYYLSCSFCRWSSLEIGLQAETPNQLIADNIKREKSSKAQAEFTSLVENLQKEIQERAKDRRQMRFPKRYYRFASRNLQNTTKASSLTLPPKSLKQVEEETASKVKTFVHVDPPTKSTPSFDELLDDKTEGLSAKQHYSQVLCLSHTNDGNLYPRRRSLLTKRSKRCSDCEKILIKPELATDKSDFKQHLTAFSHLPRITISKVPRLKINQESVVTFVLTNPLRNIVYCSFLEPKDEDLSNVYSTATYPKGEIVVGASDLVELEEEYQELIKKDDKTIICKRQANRVFLNVPVTPRSAECKLLFTLVVRQQQQAATQPVKTLEVPLQINLGVLTQ